MDEIEMAHRPAGPGASETRKSPEFQPATGTQQQPQSLTSRPASVTGSDGKKRSKWRLTAIVAALYLSEFVAALNVTTVATAAPTISRDLSSAAGYTWIGAAPLLAQAATAPIWAKISDIWGRKLLILVALAFFFASSAVCGAAPNMEALIVGRAVQGAAGGGLMLLVHVVISDLFSLRQRSLIMGLTEGIWAVAAGIGPVIGGVFASLVSWRWCFYVNLPICGLAFILILLFLDTKHEQTSLLEGLKAVDWLGIFTFLGFTVMVLLGLDFGGAIFPWDSAKVIALLVVGGVMIFAFVYSQARVSKYPLIPVEMFKKKTIVATLVVGFVHGFVFGSAEYYLPLFFQSVLGASPVKSGVLLLPFIVTTALGGVAAGVIIHHTGRFHQLMWVGSIFLCVGFGLFITFDAHTSTARAIGYQVIGGIGSGFLFTPPVIAIQSQVKQEEVATASSTLGFVRNIAISISLVIGGTIFMNSMDDRAPFLREAGLPPDVLHDLKGENAMANVMLVGSLENPSWQLAVKEAFSWSVRNLWIAYTAFAFAGVVASFFIEAAHLGTEHTETVTGLKKGKKDRAVPVENV